MTGVQRVELVERLMDRYNAGDADGYADLMTADASEALYQGEVFRNGREDVRAGLRKLFAEHPANRAEVLATYSVGERVLLVEKVRRSPEAEPFDVIAIYSFEADGISRVEFIR